MNEIFQKLANLSPERRALFEKKLQEQGIPPGGRPTIPARPKDLSVLPLSFAQQRLWFMQQLEPENIAYNMMSVLRLEGTLDRAALETALNGLVARHEPLRTRYILGEDKEPQQVIAPHGTVELGLIDLRDRSDAEHSALREIEAITGAPYDLTGTPLRIRLLQLADDDHRLVFATHHIASDRWSIGIFVRELSVLYRAALRQEPSPLPPLALHYADWAFWQRQTLSGDSLDRQLGYWKERLSGELPVLDLPFDRPREAMAGVNGAQYALKLDRTLSVRLREIATRNRISLFTLLLTVFKILLHRYTDSDDILVGSEVANRDRAETHAMIGPLVNTLVLRSDLSGDPGFEALLAKVNDIVMGGLRNQDAPFERVVEAINPERRLNELTPLFQAKFDLQHAMIEPFSLDALTLEHQPIAERSAKYELRFNLQDQDPDIGGRIEYCSDLFDEATIARMVVHFTVLLEGVASNPARPLSALPMMDEAETRATLASAGGPLRDYPRDLSLHRLFERQAERTPDAVAVTDGAASLTYRELNRKADGIAAALLLAGGGDEERCTGICMHRTVQMVAAMLGILKAGGAYVPLDPDYPAERLAFIAQDAALNMVLTDGNALPFDNDGTIVALDVTAITPADQPQIPAVAADRLAYIIYTSGSTGRPKGVAIEHCSAVARMHWAQEQFSPAELSGMLAATSICFDLSVFEIFAPLSWGGRVILADNLLALPRLPADAGITLINTVPSLLRELLKHHELPVSVRTVNLAGEPLPPALLKRLQDDPRDLTIYNLYGPSEDTTYSTGTVLPRDETEGGAVPIGKPLPNTYAYVLDRAGRLQPNGLVGELYLGGAGLARGYLGRPEQTQEKFLPDPFIDDPQARLYRTGDRVRRRMSGVLDFLGRLDHQVKIRGFRVEIGEIEHHLERYPLVQEAAVIVTGRAGDPDRQLAAYAAPKPGATLDEAALRAFLSERLPSHLVPTRWCILATLPQLPNGKIDRGALPDATSPLRSKDGREPRNDRETRMARLWATVLNRASIGIDDNFFDLGGHSLLAIRIIAAVEAEFGVRLPLKSLFRSPTVATLVESLPSGADGKEDSRRHAIVPDPLTRYEPFPLTDIQHAYWMGRSRAFELGSVGAHGYREFEADGLPVEAVEKALRQLIARHDMLRAVVDTDGRQRILEETPEYRIPVADLRGVLDPSEKLGEIRNRLSHQLFDTACWPLFHVEAARLGDDTNRFFVSFDVLIGDAWSFQLLGNELAALVADKALPSLSLTFRDYVLAERAQEESPAFSAAWVHWQSRLDTLQPAPDLPLVRALSQIETPKFHRRSAALSVENWKAFKTRSAAFGLTPTSAVMSVFCEVLARWSRRQSFTLNLTLFNRQPLHPEVDRIVGDFTASLLLGVCLENGGSFADRAQRTQERLLEDLDHRSVSGVRVLREMARRQNRPAAALMPVVFTSTLNQSAPGGEPRSFEMRLIDSVSQTPQVYLDHQVGEIDDALVFNWDAIEDLFPEGLLDDMFSAYTGLLLDLATNEDAWRRRPEPGGGDHFEDLNRAAVIPLAGAGKLLHEAFFELAEQFPDRIAVIADGIETSYGALASRALDLAAQLQSSGTDRNQLVAVSLVKGCEQAVACLGILAAGAAYVPIDPDLPHDRRWELIEDTGARIVISRDHDWPDRVIRLEASHSGGRQPKKIGTVPTDLAYVIFTSGSTGRPKGVMIDHRGANNTILDINRRFGLGRDDRAFALSSLSFDLSVYDIFGPLSLGGAVVIPTAEETRNTAHWRGVLDRHNVTVWNSVPALAQLLATEITRTEAPLALRLVMMSGDWIPVSLPDILRAALPEAAIVSLGGATEASVWSIYYPIAAVSPDWASIPYGYPLANQRWYVLDDQLRPCPPSVTGKLYIGGIGVARGYWARPSLTAERFIPDPFATETEAAAGALHLYDTGDLGRLRPDGALEFLGREDFQVKINGYRIELGEIEAALMQNASVAEAVVATHGTPPALTAYIVPKGSSGQHVSRFAAKAAVALRDKEPPAERCRPLPLPQSSMSGAFHIARQSHRRFLPDAVPVEQLSALLAELRSIPLPDAPMPKYAYPSAGGLYPVETWVLVRQKRVTGIESGWYRYHAARHELEAVARFDIKETEAVFAGNTKLASGSAFALFQIATMPALQELYGERARDFAMLEAGFVGQLLMMKAPELHLGLCSLGGIDGDALRRVLALDESHLPLYALCGGNIEAAWSETWQAVKRASGQTLPEKLGAFLSQRLPSYMVPRDFVVLENLPLTANGKLDRQALPEPAARKRQTVAPSTPTEGKVLALWCDLLENPDISMEDHLFEAGGNSLTAMRLLTRLQQEFRIELSINQLFAALTPRAQAALISSMQAASPPESAIPSIARHETANEMADADVDAMLAQLVAETTENAS